METQNTFIVEDETNRKPTSYGVQLKESGLNEGSNLLGRLDEDDLAILFEEARGHS